MKNLLLWLILSLSLFYARAQNNIPNASANQSVKITFEKTYLHTDRDVYAQGDTLWFKAYLVNAQDNKPVNSSGTLYVELIAPDSARIINREIIRLNNGLGNGDIEITDSLPAGKYRLRAYTNWMRNFGDNFVFEKPITILNTKAAPVAPDPKAPTIKNKSKTKTATPTATSPATSIQLPIVRFYPEGGSLVQGISSWVAVKAEDGYGKGIPVLGAVISSAGDTVSRFTCDSLGMGLFTLLPIKGLSYYAVVDLPRGVPNPLTSGRHDVFQIPSALSKGLTLQVKQTDSVIHAIVHASTISDSTVSITLKHTGKTVLSQQSILKEQQLTFRINTTNLPEGISAITLYDKDGKPECERLVYIHRPNSKSAISIITDKKTYQPKEQVTVNITTQPNANLSMAVVDAGIVPVQADDIVSYLQLQSEVKGNIENARRYFDTTNVNRFKQLDLLLMTQGWRDFVWRKLADTAIRISYVAEDGISVPGRIWDEVRNKMLPNVNVSLHADGAKGIKQFSTTTDEKGHFHFDGLVLYGKQNVLLSSTDGKGKDQGTFLVDTVLPLAVKYHISRPVGWSSFIDSIATAAVNKRTEIMKISKLFGVTKLKEVTIKEKQAIALNNGSVLTTWGPDQIFNITPDDYQYKTLEWYLLQNTKGAVKPIYDPNRLISPQGPNHSVSVNELIREMREYLRPLTGVAYMGQDTFLFKTPGISNGPIYSWRAKVKPIPPDIIVNGRELNMDNYEQAEAYRIIYMNMPMNKFKKIVLRHTVGTLHSGQRPILPEGMHMSWAQSETVLVDRYLLYLTLKDDAMTDNPGALSTDIDGYYQARAFYSPPPNDKPSVADYRTTIYWEPNIKTDATGKATVSFYNAVPQTDIRVTVQGLTADGKPVASVAKYNVKQPD